MNTRFSPVTLAVRALMGASVSGLAFGAEPADVELEPVYVHATAIEEDPAKIASSFSLLEGRQLRERTRATLGDTLAGLPGVHADSHAGGAARPVIRGQTAPRITVLSDSATVLDASDISPDHAVTVEPMLVERIEVLRGPATLLYGSGAIGGVVNLLDGKVPDFVPAADYEGRLAVRGGAAARERAIAAGLTARAAPNLALRFEGTVRRADDYRARGLDEPRAEGTWADSGSATAGLSWVGDDGFLGLAYTYRDDDYGIPGHNHEFESCHPHDGSLHCGSHDAEEEHEHEHEGEKPPRVALRSNRFDLRGEFRAPFALAERVRLRASYTTYRHDELEEDEVGTSFRNKGLDSRVELQHVPLARLRGVLGVQYSDTQSSAASEEAFLPTVKSRATGLFAIEHFELNAAVHFEFGARHEWVKHRPQDDPRARPAFSDSATSFSGAAVWQVMPHDFLTLSAARSERMPHPQELYARGVHLATNTYECGLLPSALTCGGAGNDAALVTETSNNIELGWRRTAGDLTFALNAFRNSVDNYIFARTLDQYEEFRLIRYSQADARFHGAEAEFTWQFAPSFSATVFGDLVRAQFAGGGGDLPRIPAARYGGRLAASFGSVGAELELFRVEEQRRIADFESTTPGHDMLNVTLRQQLTRSGLSWHLRGTNLLDERVWNHSSFLANVVPQPRRGVEFGVSRSF